MLNKKAIKIVEFCATHHAGGQRAQQRGVERLVRCCKLVRCSARGGLQLSVGCFANLSCCNSCTQQSVIEVSPRER